jgi:hypothetical protein
MITFESSSQCVCAACCGFELLSRASSLRWDELWWRCQPQSAPKRRPSQRAGDSTRTGGNRRLQAFRYRAFRWSPDLIVVIINLLISAVAGAFASTDSNILKRRVSEIIVVGFWGLSSLFCISTNDCKRQYIIRTADTAIVSLNLPGQD